MSKALEATKADKSLARRLLIPTIFMLAALAVLVSLGTWQVFRLGEKEALIADVTTRIDAAPAELPPSSAWANLDEDLYRYRKVSFAGRYDPTIVYSYMVLSDPQGGPYRGQGFWVLSPFILQSGGMVWINRGFAPRDARGNEVLDPPSGLMILTGLMRPSEQPNFATPGTDGFDDGIPDRGALWFVRHVEGMTAQLPNPSVPTAPFFVDLITSDTGSDLPQAGETRLTFSNRHFGYILTWYGLALTLLGVYGAFAWREIKKGG